MKQANDLHVVGIDAGKNSFHLVGLTKQGSMVLKKKLSRVELPAAFAQLSRCIVAFRSVCRHTVFGYQAQRTGA